MAEKKKPYAKPRWDDLDEFVAKMEKERNEKADAFPEMQRRLFEQKGLIVASVFEANRIAAAHQAELEKLRKERDEALMWSRDYQRTFDLQRKRMDAATKLWRKAHPGNENTYPDLGELLEWLMNRKASTTRTR